MVAEPGVWDRVSAASYHAYFCMVAEPVSNSGSGTVDNGGRCYLLVGGHVRNCLQLTRAPGGEPLFASSGSRARVPGIGTRRDRRAEWLFCELVHGVRYKCIVTLFTERATSVV